MTTPPLPDRWFHVPVRMPRYIRHLVTCSVFTLSLCQAASGNHDIPIPLSEEGFAASIEPRLSASLKASNEAITHHNLGLVLLSRQDIKTATDEFQAAIQLSPEFSVPITDWASA